MTGALRLYTIPPEHAFVDALAAGLLERYGRDPLTLADATVLLPTRRAVRALSEALLRASGGRPLLLPAMRAIGDVDEDMLAFEAGNGEAELELPPAIPELRRRLLLAALVRKWKEQRGAAIDAAQAAQLAAELARLLDHLQTEGLPLEALQGLAPERFAEHWGETLAFLEVLRDPWRRILEAEGAMDPAERRIRLIRALAARWRARPPSGPVIAAGSTGSIPATAELLGVIARLPQGCVVLPGLDLAMDAESWAALGPTHPQFGFRQLLERMETTREAIELWPAGAPGPKAPAARLRLIAEAMRPVETTPAWGALPELPPDALDGFVRLDLATGQEEATAIALLLREALEKPGATAALVTSDRRLARRVAAELGRWKIAIDDSAGEPLGATEPGVFLRLVAEAFVEELAPVPLLAMLKHPLAQDGDRSATLRLARLLDRRVLRGPRPAPGFAGLIAAVRAEAPEDSELIAWVERLAARGAAFAGLVAQPRAPLNALLAAHVDFAEQLSRDDAGRVGLWDGEAGEELAAFVAELAEAAEDAPVVEGRSYAALFAELMSERVLRPAWGRHPRLHIWGPLEARLQHADLLVLGGLNEGTWPAEANPDCWLSRPMRLEAGLPAPERRIGLAAHDFAQAAAAPRVVLTRAEKVDGQPTTPSRWLLRLDAVLAAANLSWPKQPTADYRDWAAALDRPERPPPRLRPPYFAPPVEARPRKLPVTDIELWMRDPYGLYAKRVLGLRALNPLDAEPGARERGVAIHLALHRFVASHPGALPADALARLLRLGDEAFGPHLDSPDVRAFWRPRFRRIAEWFLENERALRAAGGRAATEVDGEIALRAPAGPFTLTARADRIEIGADGRLTLIDYKTGAAPQNRDVLSGWAPQLPLEAAIAAAGGFPGVPKGEIESMAFWRLTGGPTPGERVCVRGEMAEIVAEAEERLLRLVAAFDAPGTPYRARPRPDAAPRYSDYEHLARVREWSVSGAEQE